MNLLFSSHKLRRLPYMNALVKIRFGINVYVKKKPFLCQYVLYIYTSVRRLYL